MPETEVSAPLRYWASKSSQGLCVHSILSELANDGVNLRNIYRLKQEHKRAERKEPFSIFLYYYKNYQKFINVLPDFEVSLYVSFSHDQ